MLLVMYQRRYVLYHTVKNMNEDVLNLNYFKEAKKWSPPNSNFSQTFLSAID